MNYKQLASLAALIIGVGLVVFSLQRMDTFRESVSLKIKGKYSNETMWYLAGGLVLVIFGGSGAVIFKREKKK